MIWVVLDTNIIVSALLNPLGPPAQILSLVAGGAIRLCVSANIYDEYEEVIRQPRFRRDEDIIIATLLAIREKGFWVRPAEAIRACTDPDDDIFLECAQGSPSWLPGNWQHQGLSRVLAGDPDRNAAALPGDSVG